MKALAGMLQGFGLSSTVILFGVLVFAENATTSSTTTETTTMTSTYTLTATVTSTVSTTMTSTQQNFVNGVMQVTISSCSDLQTPAAIAALKTGIAALAEVPVGQVSTVDVLCARRLGLLPRKLDATSQIQYGIRLLGTDNAQSIKGKMESPATATQQLQNAIQAAGLSVTLSVDSLSASVGDSPPTTSTSTSTTTTTSSTVASTTTVQGTTDGGFPMGALIAIIVICAVLILILLPVGGIMYRNQVQEQRVMDVRKLDDEVNQLETLFDELTTQVDIFQDKCQKEMEGRNQREFQERVGDKQANFMQKWRDFVTEEQKFLREEYAPEMKRRQPGGPGIDVSRQPSAAKPPTLAERLWPPMPATPPHIVQKQRATLGRLDKTMKETCEVLGQQVHIAFPAGIPELPNPGVLGSIRSEPVNASLQQEVSLLAPFTHPLLAQATVKPHGVLGTSVAPFTEIPAVVVDPAGWRYVGKTGEVKGAGGAAGAIYDWLGLKKTGGKFPAEVRQHFSTNTEEEAETRAKYCAYNTGMCVIHVVGPKIRTVQNALHDLSRTYVNVFDEFCKVFEGPAATSRPASQVLRLLPISSGIFLQNRKLDRYMPEITWSAIALAFGMLPVAQREILRNSSIEVCIFKKAEFKAYAEKLSEKKSLLGTPPMLKLTESMGAVPDKGGFDWVRTKNGPSDRLERLACFTRTAHALASQGYSLPKGGEAKLDLQSTLQGTEVVKSGAFSSTGSGTKVLRHENLTVMEVALKTQSAGKPTMAVNAASAYQVGGGVMSGGRHALEETWCTMSTLLPSLQKVQWEDRRTNSHSGHSHHLQQHIPVDACILSPNVQVFRDTSAKGYRFQEQPVALTGVCSMAMFNMNSRVADSPLDAPEEFSEYCRQVKDKFKAALACMQKLKATVLVCPDVGCGVFENDPEVMGCLLGEAVLDYPGDMEIVATGKPAFFEALRRTVEANPKLPPRETAPPPATFARMSAPPPPKYAPKAKPRSAPAPSVPSASDGPAPVEAKAVSPVPSATPKAPAKSAAVPGKSAAVPAKSAAVQADPKAKAKAAALS